MSKIRWNQDGIGNVHVTDGREGYWAAMPPETTAAAALDEYLSTANYSAATMTFTVRATVLSGAHEGETADREVAPWSA